ncbi:protein kinase [Streptomyces roseifaciens]|uniref:protein kinase n=1 Tax=Streptomyces roseifaciens TaxID=1488406 RepID=UPI0007C8760F|nr:protein kinase [Streptomyces roseifaciens]
MDDYAGRILADRYRLPLPPSDVFELVETRAFDTLSGQEVLVRQIPLPEVVDAEVLDGAPGAVRGAGRTPGASGAPGAAGAGSDPAVRRALAAAAAAAQVPDHPRLDQVFHVFAEGGSLWVVSELLPARPLAALLAERTLSPHRAAEVAADVLTALRALHAHGWTHRNITTRTVLICDDGRAILTGLAVGAAEEALCGYNPVPDGQTAPEGLDGRGQGGMPMPRDRGGSAGRAGPRRPGDGGAPGAAGRGAGGGPGGYNGPGGGAPGGGAPGGYGPGVGASGSGEPGPRPAQSPYRDQGAVGGFLPPGGPGAPVSPWPPEGFRPLTTGGPGAGPPTTGRSPGHPGPDGQGFGRPGGRSAEQPGGQDTGYPGGQSAGLLGPRGAGQAGGQGPGSVGDQATGRSGGQSAGRPSGWGPGYSGVPGAGLPGPGRGAGLPGGQGAGCAGGPGVGSAGGQGGGRPGGQPPGPGYPGGQGAGHMGRQGAGQPGGPGGRNPSRPGAQGSGQAGRDGGPRQVRSAAIAAYREGAARAAAARAAGRNASPATPTGSSTWGGGSAASGSAPVPAPRGAGPLHGAPPGRNRPGGPADGTNAARPDVPEVKLPGTAASWPSLPGLTPGPPPPRPAVTPPRAPADPVEGNAAAPAPAPAPEPPPPRPAANAPDASPAWGAPGQQPGSPLAAERARQARMVVVGAVTERWAPEQAWPVQESWQLAPPVGPAADLWALGALLFRVVQGHAPYPEDSAAELVRIVCAEPPAFAEECGALRPVVESLMRKDPAERPEFEELRGWLRSLIRSAPEPDPGGRTLMVPPAEPEPPADGRHRLPVVRRKGEVVRRRRGSRSITAVDTAPAAHGRHKKTAKDNTPAARPAEPRTGHLQEQRGRPARSAYGLGRLLLGLVLLLLLGAVLYAMLFMPRAEESAGQAGRAPADLTGTAGAHSAAPHAPATAGKSGGSSPPATSAAPVTSASPEARSADSGGPAEGFALRQDPKGFTVAVAKDWQRRGENDRGQVVYAGGDYRLIVVPGRDKVAEFGSDPMAYQQEKEPELAEYRSSSWAGASGLRRIDVGRTASAEGTFNWTDSSGRQVYVRNSATILGGRYHLLQVIGPVNEQRAVDRFFEQAAAAYRAD